MMKTMQMNQPSCSQKIPYEIIQKILEMGCSLQKKEIWYPTLDISTGSIRYRFNKHTENRGIILIDHMLRFKKNNPPRFHLINIGFYILDSISYPCVEYTLSKETHGRKFVVGEPHDETFSLSRKYIVTQKENDTVDYIYLDTHYDIRDSVFYSARRHGWIIRNDDENYDYDSINDIMHYYKKYKEPWDIETHGKLTYKYDINSWNWDYSGEVMTGSDYDEFWEESSLYDEDYACLSFSWKSENNFDTGYNYENGSFAKFVRYNQLEMDTVQMIW